MLADRSYENSCHTAAAAAAAAKLLQSCVTLCDPIGGSPPGSPILGFSRQEHWNGLPFPSPVREKWKWSRSVVSDSSRPHGLQPARLLHPWGFLGKSTGVGCHCLLHSTYYQHSYLQYTWSLDLQQDYHWYHVSHSTNCNQYHLEAH